MTVASYYFSQIINEVQTNIAQGHTRTSIKFIYFMKGGEKPLL